MSKAAYQRARRAAIKAGTWNPRPRGGGANSNVSNTVGIPNSTKWEDKRKMMDNVSNGSIIRATLGNQSSYEYHVKDKSNVETYKVRAGGKLEKIGSSDSLSKVTYDLAYNGRNITIQYSGTRPMLHYSVDSELTVNSQGKFGVRSRSEGYNAIIKAPSGTRFRVHFSGLGVSDDGEYRIEDAGRGKRRLITINGSARSNRGKIMTRASDIHRVIGGAPSDIYIY